GPLGGGGARGCAAGRLARRPASGDEERQERHEKRGAQGHRRVTFEQNGRQDRTEAPYLHPDGRPGSACSNVAPACASRTAPTEKWAASVARSLLARASSESRSTPVMPASATSSSVAARRLATPCA